MKNLIIVITILFCGTAFAQSDNSQFEKILKNNVETKNFQGSVLIADKGKIIFHESYGLANQESGIPLTNETTYTIASITKMVTALVILQLVEEKKLALDNNLKELFPEFKIKRNDQITVHHLLLHISGLPNEPSSIYSSLQSPEEFVEITLEKGKHNGTFNQFNYANIDYILLGLIIKKIEDKPWKEVVQERILDPLKLKRTGFLKMDETPKDHALTYRINSEGVFEKDPVFYIENFGAAAGMYSTTEDLLKLDQALYTDLFLNEDSKKLFYTGYPEYGYVGYSVWNYNYPYAEGMPRISERRGGILGANVVLIRLTELNKTIIILSNNNAFNPDSWGDSENLREALIQAAVNSVN